MKRVVRSKLTQKYFQADGNWSSCLDKAYNFVNTHLVLETVRNYRLTDVELILMIADQPTVWDIVLPLRSQIVIKHGGSASIVSQMSGGNRDFHEVPETGPLRGGRL